MRHASRSIYISFHGILSLLAKCARGAPIVQSALTLEKRAIGEGLSPGTTAGYVVFIVFLVILSGITAGLTLGLMSLDETQLYVLSQSRSPKQKKHAAKIIPIRKNGHLLLVSLLLMNVICNETLPIISEKVLGSGVISVVISTIMIVIFSEILPQAVCSTHGLAVGAAMAVPVKVAIVLMFVIAWPVAKLLDLILGENHGMVYRRAELKELIDFHSKQAQHGGDLSIDAVTIMRGALDLQEKKVRNSMTYIDDVFMLHADSKLDRKTIQRIVESGHSRVPIYKEVDDEASAAEVAAGEYSEVAKRRSIIGCLLAKNLLLIDPDDDVPLSSVTVNHIPSVQDDLPLFDILNIFQEGRSHLAIVVRSPPALPQTRNQDERGGSRSSSETVVEVAPRLWTDEEMSKLEPIGIITLEDVLEELIQEPIWDETDTTEVRPRAGLAVPLNTGTGETLILATSRGRPAIRGSRSAHGEPSFITEASAISKVASTTKARESAPIELVNFEQPISAYDLSRSNSKAPADAKIPASSDPFADDSNPLVSKADVSLSNKSNLPTIRNKHLSHIKPSRPLSLDMPLSDTSKGQSSPKGTLAKNRFKSRSTSSSSFGSARRTQSAREISYRRDGSSNYDFAYDRRRPIDEASVRLDRSTDRSQDEDDDFDDLVDGDETDADEEQLNMAARRRATNDLGKSKLGSS